MGIASVALLLAGLAGAARASPRPPNWRAPAWWLRQAACIHSREGAWNANTGNGYYGGMQFLLSTWRLVGGTNRPDVVTPREQLYRAYILWKRDGGRWWIGNGGSWGDSARACGLT